VVRRDGNLQGEGVLLEGMPIILRLTRRHRLLDLEERKRQGGHIGSIFGILPCSRLIIVQFMGLLASHSTPASATFGSVINHNMIRFASIPFWTAAGGLQLHDTGVAASTFIGDIIIRGGRGI